MANLGARKRALWSTTIAAGALLATPLMAQTTSTDNTGRSVADPAPVDADSGLTDIVVTATRTESSVQKAPVAVTAFSGESLSKLQITNLKDISQIAPNVQIATVTGGSAGIVPFIRGGGVTDGANITSEPEVGIYIDDVYQPRAAASFIEALDVERVEVLRGPQGTLYGRNSSAGALKIVTRLPAKELSGKAEAGYGSWDEVYGKASISGPLTSDGVLRAGISAMVRDRGGGRQYAATLGKDVGAEDYQGVQGDLFYDGDPVTIRLKGFYSNYDSDGLYAVGLDPFSDETDYLKVQPASGSYRRVLTPRESYTHTKQYGGSLHINARLSDDWTLSAITGVARLTDAWSVDFSGGVPLSAIGIPSDQIAALFVNTAALRDTSFSQELQLHGSAANGLLTFIGGLYYFRETGTQTVLSEVFFSEIPHTFNVKTDSYAAFGQLGVHPIEGLTITAGGRYTEDHKALDASVLGLPVRRRDSWKDFLPKLGVDYQVTPDVLVYASYSEGFKAGGYNGLANSVGELDLPYDPQKVQAYEIGFKTEFLDRRARVNVSAFINDYSSIQQQFVTDTGTFLTQNYAAQHKGIEAELSYKPSRPLTLYSNIVYNDGKYKEDSSSQTQGSFVGNSMTNIFKWQVTAGGDLTLPIGPGNLVFGGNYTYRSDYYSTPDNLFYGHVPATNIVNGYLGYDLNRWSLRVAAKNLTDDRYWTTGFGFSVVRPRFLGDPRTFRASIAYRF